MRMLNSIFKVSKPVIGMLHIDELKGTKGYKGLNYLVERARSDIKAMQDGGIDGILIENWKEDSVGEFISEESAESLTEVVQAIVGEIKVPFGINVLNNDYKVALTLAKLVGADFVEFDVFVDEVESDFSYSEEGKKNPFVIKVNPTIIFDFAKKIGAENIPILCFVQPKHYKMLDKNKTIEESVKQAVSGGASGILVTKATGVAPTLDLVKRAKVVAGEFPIGIGSGFDLGNARDFLKVVDFAVVGTSIKQNQETDNPVDAKRVRELMDEVIKCRELTVKN